jgi:hypothetical protein
MLNPSALPIVSAGLSWGFDPKQVALTILGNLEKFKIGRDDLGC